MAKVYIAWPLSIVSIRCIFHTERSRLPNFIYFCWSEKCVSENGKTARFDDCSRIKSIFSYTFLAAFLDEKSICFNLVISHLITISHFQKFHNTLHHFLIFKIFTEIKVHNTSYSSFLITYQNFHKNHKNRETNSMENSKLAWWNRRYTGYATHFNK